MSLPLIATAIYPMPQSWIDAFFAGIAALKEPVILLLQREAGTAMPVCDLPGHRVISPEAPSGVTGADLRATMLQAALAQAPECVICLDYDDVVMPEAVSLHRAALRTADISFGDMFLIDGAGADCGVRFFDAMSVPQDVTGSTPITRQNFLGFTNTAVQTGLLKNWDGKFPDDVVAADWWLFSSWLDAGARARQAVAPVVCYRSHDNSLLGARKAADLTRLRRKLLIAQAHFAALSGRADRRAAQESLGALAKALETRPAAVTRALASLPDFCLWFQDVFALADSAGEST